MITANGIKGEFITYKGLPLVRQDNEIYYGDLSDKHHLFVMIMGYAKSEKFGIEIPNKVMVQIQTKEGLPVPGMQIIVSSLSEAFEYGCPWLERANRE